MNSEEIAKAIIEKMKTDHHIFWVDPEMHSTQHEFIQILIDERKDRKARRDRIKEKVAGSLILSGIITLITFTGVGFLDWVSKHLK